MTHDQQTPEDARRENARQAARATEDRAEVDALVADLHFEATRNHFAERLQLAFQRRRDNPA